MQRADRGHCGLVGVWKLSLPRHTWWLVPSTMLLLTMLAWFAGPASENINFAFGLPKGWEEVYPSHGFYMVLCTVSFTVASGVLQLLLRRVGFAAPGEPVVDLEPKEAPS